ncbi:MAG TPA: molybdopterin cofactor-binding domain-containing protein [Rhodanobacteraceae bacterium]|nr:molybdopterin cofactor-binding domain-containing protein [Rhodanobacteraceae bacterium]
MSEPADRSRRRFLQVMALAGGGLLVGLRSLPALAADPDLALLGENTTALGPYLRVEPDGRIFIGARAPDFGQGSHTALARIIADEFAADWTRVTVLPMALGVVSEHGTPQFTLGTQDARGSTTMAAAWEDLRQVGASARWLMREAAARHWKQSAAELRCAKSRVIAPGGASLSYGELAAAAAKLSLPTTPPALKQPQDYALIGQRAGDVDADAMVRGRQRFVIDAWPADALVAVLARCPCLDGDLQYFDDSAARKVDGVEQIVQLPAPSDELPLGTRPLAAAVAVLARSTWAALQGRKALQLHWQARAHADESTAGLLAQAQKVLDAPEDALAVRRDGDVEAADRKATKHVEATYALPYLAHVTMEPLAVHVRIESDRATLQVPTQDPAAAFAVTQRLTGLKAEQIDINFPRMGGGFGRRLDSDFVAEAILVAQAAKRPIKLMWTRDDDLANDAFRPFSLQRIRASLDRHGRILGWRQHMASTSPWHGRGVPQDGLWHAVMYPDDPPAGLVDNLELLWHGLDSAAARGNYRAPGHNATAFAVECFLDEIAHAARRDPLALRLELLGEARTLPYRGFGGPTLDTGRLAAVLRAVAERIEWTRRRRNGHGLGIACHFTFGSYAAHAFEVSTRAGKLRFQRAVCAVDVGRAINPLGVVAQAEGATLDALSAALGQAITIDHGTVQQRALKHYRMARTADLPRRVEVIVMPSQVTPTGAGEVAFPSAAPALANAVFAATTARIRSLPLLPGLQKLL